MSASHPPKPAVLLLMPGYAQALAIRARLAELQRRYHGVVTAPLHLVCQRLQGPPEALGALGERLEQLARETPPVPVTATELEPFYSTFYQRESLKCHVNPSAPLLALSEALERALAEVGLEPQTEGPELRVTLLEQIRIDRLVVTEYRQPLFTGERLVLAEPRAPGRYRALQSASLGEGPAASSAASLKRFAGALAADNAPGERSE